MCDNPRFNNYEICFRNINEISEISSKSGNNIASKTSKIGHSENEKRPVVCQTYFFTRGHCYDQRCPFSHHNAPNPNLNCFHYFQTGKCPQGEECKFYHESKPCKYFFLNRKCKFLNINAQKNCKFSHRREIINKIPCARYFDGKCMYEKNCWYSHSPSLLMPNNKTFFRNYFMPDVSELKGFDSPNFLPIEMNEINVSENVFANPGIFGETCFEDPGTFGETCFEDPGTSAETCFEDPGTSAETCFEDPGTSAETCFEDPGTSAETCFEDPGTSAEICFADPGASAEICFADSSASAKTCSADFDTSRDGCLTDNDTLEDNSSSVSCDTEHGFAVSWYTENDFSIFNNPENDFVVPDDAKNNFTDTGGDVEKGFTDTGGDVEKGFTDTGGDAEKGFTDSNDTENNFIVISTSAAISGIELVKNSLSESVVDTPKTENEKDRNTANIFSNISESKNCPEIVGISETATKNKKLVENKLPPYRRGYGLKKCEFCLKKLNITEEQFLKHSKECEHLTNNSKNRVCIICKKTVRRFGLLEGCHHVFCYDCTLKKGNLPLAKNDRILKECPVCRSKTRFVLPSSYYVTGDRKQKEFSNYKLSRASIPCRYYKSNSCWINDCYFLH